MKPNKLFLVALIAMMTTSVNSFADDMMIPAEQLPAAAKTFIKQQFPKQAIAYAQKDGFVRPTYEARLNDGTEIDFDTKGNWDKVDCKHAAVPTALIPATIANYVRAKFPGTIITKIDKEHYGYEVELSNDLELKFNKGGKLLKMDD